MAAANRKRAVCLHYALAASSSAARLNLKGDAQQLVFELFDRRRIDPPDRHTMLILFDVSIDLLPAVIAVDDGGIRTLRSAQGHIIGIAVVVKPAHCRQVGFEVIRVEDRFNARFQARQGVSDFIALTKDLSN